VLEFNGIIYSHSDLVVTASVLQFYLDKFLEYNALGQDSGNPQFEYFAISGIFWPKKLRRLKELRIKIE
jgi:hypothetical protein